MSEPLAPLPALSVVVPCYNEEDGLGAFFERMNAACQAHAGGSYEIIFVNDGSRDATWPRIRAMSRIHPGVVAVNLSRNHGHQLAVSAGLSLARGKRILVIDADLQDPPELLGAMMRRMDEGFDVVYGRRNARAGETPFKRASAYLFYRLLDRLSETPIPMDVGDFRLMGRQIVDRLNAMPEQDRFLRGMISWLGGRQTEIAYDRDPRFAGTTGYSARKMIGLAMAGLTSFSTAPLRLAAIMTACGVGFAFLVGLYVLYGLFFGKVTPGWTSLALIVAIFSTAQMASLAVLSIYVGRIFTQVKMRPLYIIDEVDRSPAKVALTAPDAPEPLERQNVA
ncbi:MAG TPA: glycosyltransferase family 2 protein [Rhodoblastus sp.]|nr:glycosyltransferase family 2 protein [Rhodoblastus sp.]